MTKKFIVGYESSNTTEEFVLPDYFGDKKSFIGIESKKRFLKGKIVYTGVELDPQKVIEKYLLKNKIGFINKFRLKKKLTAYLSEIKAIKIGSVVQLKDTKLAVVAKNKY